MLSELNEFSPRKKLPTSSENLDWQHEKITKLLGGLQHVPGGLSTTATFSELFSSLMHAFFAHFEAEEKLMSAVGLPEEGIEAHKTDHGQILQTLISINDEVMSSKNNSSVDIHRRINDELQSHFLNHDSKLLRLVQVSGEG